MKTVVLSLYEAYPPESGAAVVTYNTALHLPGQTTLIQLGRAADQKTLKKNLSVITIPAASGHRLKKAFSLRKRFKPIIDRILEIGPDILMMEGASWAPYYYVLLRRLKRAGFGGRIIYHAHNVEYNLRRERKDTHQSHRAYVP